ncbi:unnamed protein product [Penicillium salamii]|nr:unnamed protein product [Penicillium salamii]CAG8308253.1 unnamed protein product [Penicillium salamii]
MASRGERAPTLFGGARFWLSQTVPQRTRLKEDIQKHGGVVVLMEKDADVKLVDHKRKNLPKDTFSYQYVERSIANCQLEDLEAHRSGPSAPRPMGATNIPTKGKRSVYTLGDDQIVFDWIYHFAKSPGAPVQGNKFYQDLSELFPSHPWQSWRSRYTKVLHGKPRPGGGVPLTFDEIIECAPSQGQRPRILPTRTSEPTRAAVARPNAPTSATGQADTSNSNANMKRKRASVPETPNQPRPDLPSKRRAVEVQIPVFKVSPSRRPPQPQPSPTITAAPARRTDSENDSSADSSSSSPKAGLGITEIPPQPARTPPSHPLNRPTIERPETTTELPKPPRPPGDNAFAKLARFNQQPTKPRQPARDPLEDPIDPVFLELPFPPSSPEPEATDDDTSEIPDIDTWMDERLARGVNETYIFDALACTSMDPMMADKILKHLSAGKGIPRNVRGVWTAEDDECFQSEEHAKVQRALSKHGAEAYKARWEYFRGARESGFIE